MESIATKLRVNKCCCTSLRNGGFIVGWICIFITILNFVLNIEYYAQTMSSEYSTEGKLETYGYYVGHVLQITVNVFLFVGIIKNKYNYLLPWLVVYALGMGLDIVQYLFMLVMCIQNGRFPYCVLHSRVPMVIQFAITLWFWIVVYSLYAEIKKSNQVLTRLPVEMDNIENGQIDGEAADGKKKTAPTSRS